MQCSRLKNCSAVAEKKTRERVISKGVTKLLPSYIILISNIYKHLLRLKNILYRLLPESPYWLLSTNKLKEASKLLKQIALANGKTLEEEDFEKLLKQEVGHTGL